MNTLLGFLATYLLHSSILLGLAWLADRLLRGRPHWQELLWKVALVGGLLTAAAQTTSALRPWGGTWTLGAEPPALAAPMPLLAPGVPLTEPGALPATTTEPSAPLTALASLVEPSPAAAVIPQARWSVLPVLLGAWAAGALILLGLLARAWGSHARRLRDRRLLDREPIQRALSALASRAPAARAPRLTASPSVAVPMAMGIFRPEICLPERVLAELSREAQESLLAHELGHLVRRDPLFRLLAIVIERAFFFQPLNWLATRKLASCAELLSDDWAARRTARPLALAECLTTVARWTVRPVRGLPVAAAITGPSELRQRIERLLRGEGLTSGTPRPAWAGPMAACAMVAFTLVAPSACGGAEAAGKPPATPQSARADEDTETRDLAEDDDTANEDESTCDRGPATEEEKAHKGAQDRKEKGHARRGPPAVARRAPHPHDDDADEDEDENAGEDEAPGEGPTYEATQEASGDDADNDNDADDDNDADTDDDEPSPPLAQGPSLNLDLNIDFDPAHVDEQLDRLQEKKAQEKAREREQEKLKEKEKRGDAEENDEQEAHRRRNRV